MLLLPLLAVVTGCSTIGSGGVATPTAVIAPSTITSGPPTSGVGATSSGGLTGDAVTSRSGGFSVVPPSGWAVATDQVTDVPGLDIALLSGERIASFNNNLVVIASDGDQATADAELAKGRRQLGATGTVTDLPARQIAGEQAKGISTAFEEQGVKVVARSFAVHHQGTVYLLTLTSSPEGADVAMAEFDRIVSTWTWL